MCCLRAIAYLFYRKKEYKSLVFPTFFFLAEVLVSMVIIFALLVGRPSEKVFFAESRTAGSVFFVKSSHSDSFVAPYGKASQKSLISIEQGKTYKVWLFVGSLVCSFIGIFISVLWINSIFRKNNININWWLWPSFCWSAHLLFFFMASN
jgi:hypothetical protein